MRSRRSVVVKFCVAVAAAGLLTANAAGVALAAPVWAIQPTPTPSPDQAYLRGGVSCTAPDACTSVGYFSNGEKFVTLAERWNGTRWSVQPTPNPTGATRSELAGVSCPSATVCVAVGDYANAASDVFAFSERWSGSAWVVKPVPKPSGAAASELHGVSCTSASACLGVGSYLNSSNKWVTFAARWNGTTWSLLPTPNPTGARASSLRDVSCVSATACTAVGYFVNSSGTFLPLVERWNGSAWALQSAPTRSGATESALNGVSCPSPTACTAVGYFKNASNVYLPLAARWNGTSWTVQSTPAPTGAPTTVLQSVSCASLTACTAVGSYVASTGQERTLAEHWNGTSWVRQATPNPSGAAFSVLNGVSCVVSTLCTATGAWQNNTSGVIRPLAERYA